MQHALRNSVWKRAGGCILLTHQFFERLAFLMLGSMKCSHSMNPKSRGATLRANAGETVLIAAS